MIEKFEIIKYKCFNDFTLEGLSRINVISGKNNVGKTALLEAFYLSEDFSALELLGGDFILFPLATIMDNRGITTKIIKNHLYSLQYKVIINNENNLSFQYQDFYSLNDKENQEYKKLNQDYKDFLSIKVNNKLVLIPLDEINSNKYHDGFYINSSKPTNTKLVELYSEIQTNELQHHFLKYLQILDKNIMWIEPQLIEKEMFLRINLENPKHSLLSSELGEGTNRFIQILATILFNSNGMVFIDEIENGLHYSRLYDIWKAIIEIVRKENVQLFVTTHDNESIEALNQASEDSNFKEITSIKLFKNEENKIVPTIKTYDNFSYGINRGADIR